MPHKKKEKLVQFNKDNILEAAEKLFSEKGIKETTMDDISKIADYSKSTIYTYFKSKEEIFNCITYKHMCHFHKMVNNCIKEFLNFEQCYFNICSALAETYEQYPLYFESMMINISIDKQDMEKHKILQQIYEVGELINNSIILIFEKGFQENYLRDNLPILPTAFALWSSLANIIIISDKKEKYIEKRMKMNKSEFMQHSFKLLLSSIKRG